MKHPANYKTQSGLIKALTRNSERAMDVSLAWWFKNAEYVLIDRWGWQEAKAARFVASYLPRQSAYRANS
jgi:hypothetical protein